MDIRQARRELKFLLRGGDATAVISEIRSMLPSDRNGAVGGAYPIISEYYDTEDRNAYWERMRKLRNRRKLRVRIYGSENGAIPASAFLEVKHKRDGVGVKRRVAVPLEQVTASDFDIEEMIRGMETTAERTLVEELKLLLEVKRVRPVMQMRYDRLAFEGPDDVRVTFDTGIRCRSERKPLRPDDPDFVNEVTASDACVLELKLFGNAPYWLRDLAAKYGLRKIPFSKYCNALEMFDPVVSTIVSNRGAAAV